MSCIASGAARRAGSQLAQNLEKTLLAESKIEKERIAQWPRAVI